MKTQEVKELVGHSQPCRPRRARAQAGLGWAWLQSPPASADTPARLPLPPVGEHRVCWTAVLNLPWMLPAECSARPGTPFLPGTVVFVPLSPSLGWMPTHMGGKW